MKKEALALLLGYLKNQRAEIDSLTGEISNTEPVDKEKTVYLGYLIFTVHMKTCSKKLQRHLKTK